MSVRQFCTFRVGDHWLGVDVSRVQEVLRSLPITSLPGATSVIRGLINLRGEIVLAIDLGHRLKIDAASAQDRKLNVVVSTKDGPVSLLVDEVGDVVEIDEGTSVSQNSQSGSPELVSTTFALPGSLLQVLDLDTVTDISDQLSPAAHAIQANESTR